MSIRLLSTMNASIFLTEVVKGKAFMIIADTIGEQMLTLIHEISQLDTIYIFYKKRFRHEQVAKE
jgi:hypothetical protein